jgi:hypothetical protein
MADITSDETTKLSKTQTNDACWDEHLKAFNASNQACSVYCKEHGLDYDRFSYRVRKAAALKGRAKQQLIPVCVKRTSSAPDLLCRIELSGGHCVQVYDNQILQVILERIL